MNNLHIVLGEATNPSRILKETSSIVKFDIAKKVFIAALYLESLEKEHVYTDDIVLNRFELKTRKLSKNFFVQILKYIEFCFRVTKFYKSKNIKMVNIHGVKLFPLGIFLKYFYGAKLIYDAHELETEQKPGKNIRKTLLKMMERFFIKKVDSIFVVSESIADWYKDEYDITRPTVVMNAPIYKEITKTNILRQNLNIKDESIILLYQGGLSADRGLELLIEAMQKRQGDRVVTVFMGYGEMEEYIKIVSKNSKNIFFHPAVDPSVLLDYTSSADIGITAPIFSNNTCLSYTYSMPNKLFEYAMAGLPVIVSNLKDATQTVRNYNLGVVIEYGNSDCINKAIDEILTKDFKEFSFNALNFSKKYCWEKQEEKMINEYKRLLNKCAE